MMKVITETVLQTTKGINNTTISPKGREDKRSLLAAGKDRQLRGVEQLVSSPGS